ncbi:MAG TPA: bile acid:sodium symporter [Gemmataceae bacterium]|nr:bile acid:sodium symporter [Gemmataceae bacterium]
MKSFLARRWFLLLLVVGLAVAGWRPDWLRPAVERLPPRAVVALALFLMAWGLDSRSLGRSLLRPLPALWAVAISYGALPALAYLAGRLMPADALRIGLMISASVPCTLASAVLWTRMAGGNEATALLVIVLTTSTSWLATTLWLVAGTGTTVAVDAAPLMRDLMLCLIVPVGLGQLGRTIGPLATLVTRCRKAVGVIAQLLIFSIIMKAAVGVHDGLNGQAAAFSAGALATAAAVCVGTHLAALAAGFWSGSLFGFDRPSRIAIAFAGSQKTLPVALLLLEGYFKEYPLAVVSLLFYHVGQLVVDTFIADGLARRKPAAIGLPPEALVE